MSERNEAQMDVSDIWARIEKAKQAGDWNAEGFAEYLDHLDIEYLLLVISLARTAYVFWTKHPRSLANQWDVFLRVAGYGRNGSPTPTTPVDDGDSK